MPFGEAVQGKMTHELASTTKAWTTLRGREVVSLGRELLGGNGVVSDFLVRLFASLPPTTASYIMGTAAFECAAVLHQQQTKYGFFHCVFIEESADWYGVPVEKEREKPSKASTSRYLW
jgi:hypothetical protein